jgi:2'-5' RNA ligase
MKWVGPGPMHLTLAFIGQLEDTRVAKVAQAMRDPMPMKTFDLSFGGLGVFPGRGAPRVLWLGVVGGRRELLEVQISVTRRLRELDIPLEDRPYHPHLTLARWQRSRPSDGTRVPGLGAAALATMTVRAATLFESRLSSAGATHIPLCRAALGEATPQPLQS